MNKQVTNKYLSLALKIILFFVLDETLGIGTKILRSILEGAHGAPSFVTSSFTLYGIITKLLFVFAYLLLQHYIPVKNRFLKSFTFVFFFWATDYLPQVLGMFGAYSPVIDPVAVSVHAIIVDSIGYIITALLLGLLLTTGNFNERKACARKQFILAGLASLLIFPLIIIIGELIAGCIAPSMTCATCFGIRETDVLSFYIVFYLFQGVSGLLFVPFYRFTQYNSPRSNNWLIFATINGIMLWTPLVIIMLFFGTPIAPTISFAVIMLIAIYIDTYVFAKILESK